MSSPLLMEWNEKSTSQWEWENLFMFNAKATENSKSQRTEWGVEGDQGTNSASFYSSVGGRGSGGYDMESGHTYLSKSSTSASANSSSIGDSKTSKLAFEAFRSSPNNFNSKEELAKVESNESSPTLEPSSGCGESLLSLKLGKQMYFEDAWVGGDAEISNFSMIPMSSPTTSKKFKSSCKSTHPQHCQVEGCNLDLTSAKDYHRKHRVCESHSKSPKVVVGGRECRFCQQCSRFHNLSAFDEKKRSCRRRLSDHNARRRKPQPEAVRFNSARLSSSPYDGKRQMSLVSGGVPLVYTTAAANLTWEDICNRKCIQTKEHPLKPAKARDTEMQLCFSSSEMPSIIKTLNHDSGMLLPSKGNIAEVLNPGLEEPMISMERDAAQDFRCALSLLSTDSRTSQEARPAPHPHANHNSHSSMPQHSMNLMTQGLSQASTVQWRTTQQYADPRPHILNSSNKSSSHFQDFQLFKAPHELGFYSNRLH